MANSFFEDGGYSEVNGLKMYYEVYGKGKPLVLIHGGGSTIQTSFGRIIPKLAGCRQVIGAELQAHGHTNDRVSELTFEQDADDVARLLENLGISKADILGFSNGGHTTIEMAIRHPGLVNKIILCSTFYKRAGVSAQFWEGMKQAKFSDMPQPYKDEYLKITGDPTRLMNMFNKDVFRIQTFADWSDEKIKSIKAPALVVNGDADLASPEHTVEMFRTIPNCQLAIIPGGHGEYLGEITFGDHSGYTDLMTTIINKFLDN